MPLPTLHRREVRANVKKATAPDLSLRGRSAPVAISGRHSQPVQAAVKMEKAEIWGVAAVTAQPLAALPPYGCGVPFTGSDRLVQGHLTAGGRWCTSRSPDVSLRGAKRRGNLAVLGRIVGKLSAKTQLPSRDSHVASLLGMTNLIALRRRITAAKPATANGGQ